MGSTAQQWLGADWLIAARFGYVCSLELSGPPRKPQRGWS